MAHVLDRVVVLLVRGGEGTTVGTVDDKLGVVVAGERRERGPRRSPRRAAIGRDHEVHVRAAAQRASRVDLAGDASAVVHVMGPERVDVTEAVGRDRGLPVVPGREPEANWSRKGGLWGSRGGDARGGEH